MSGKPKGPTAPGKGRPSASKKRPSAVRAKEREAIIGELASSEGEDRLTMPTAQEMLDGLTELGRDLHLEMQEEALVNRLIKTLQRLFPGRKLAIRVLDVRSMENARLYANSTVRAKVESERITVKKSSIEKTHLKRALAESARLKVGGRWDSPFPGTAAGFAVPLVASGELYGVLDVGYPLGQDSGPQDEALIIPIANQFSVALRNQRLHRETAVLRDYQTKLIEHANALILGVDRHWRITVCNQALCRLTGFQRDEVVGRDLRDWLAEGKQQRSRFTKLFLQALSGGKSDAMDVRLVTRSGEKVRTVWSVAAIGGPRQQIESVVAIGQDQTKLQELQRQVIQAEKLATLGQLAAGVVHELNNPLTSISVYADYLLQKAERAAGSSEAESDADEGDIEKLRRISAGAQRILEFARDLVQYAAPAGDELDIVSVNHVVQQSLSFCEHLFERASVSLTRELEEELPSLYAVPGQLEQVVINLVTNAVQAAGNGGAVTVRTFRDGPAMVGFSVADNGPGIAADERDRIFEPFYTSKSAGKGTGLGLSIVRNIVEQHNGQISVEEAAGGGGARFTVVLPAGG
jgi:PAS domain S-box-containing protein